MDSGGYREMKENEEENEVTVKTGKERGREGERAKKEHENGTMKRRCRKEGRTGCQD